MDIYNKSGKFTYEIENVCRLFFPNEKFNHKMSYVEQDNLHDYVSTQIFESEDNEVIKVVVGAKIDEKELSENSEIKKNTEDFKNELECLIARLLFKVLSEATLLTPSWGIVTGVRPVKLYRSLINQGGEDYASKYFSDKLLVSKEKLELVKITNKYENNILSLSKKNSFSLYIAIPFCPSRCSYCSFVSQSIEKCAKLIPDYLQLLIKEIEYTATIAKNLKLKLETVYIGGGTPTTLDDIQLAKLIEAVNLNFDMKDCREFTIEAGRPDTINKAKLYAMKNGNVNRISINPQTLNDSVLETIGRKHTAQQAIEAFSLAREVGINSINMDLIAGLPGDNYESFCNTVDKICSLSPEGITIHTLSLKRSSYLNIKEKSKINNNSNDLKYTLGKTYEKLAQKGYHPYYLYRQSRMVENMENIGWAKMNHDGLYNIYVMDETHTILACGAGGVTKLKEYKDNKIERIFNYKFAYEYISGFDEMLQRKRKVEEFYEKFQ